MISLYNVMGIILRRKNYMLEIDINSHVYKHYFSYVSLHITENLQLFSIFCLMFLHVVYFFLQVFRLRAYAYASHYSSPSITVWRTSSSHWWIYGPRRASVAARRHC